MLWQYIQETGERETWYILWDKTHLWSWAWVDWSITSLISHWKSCFSLSSFL